MGTNAAFIAIGMEADVFVLDKSIDCLRELDTTLAGRASTVHSSTLAVEEMLPRADLVIGAVLVHGARAPHVVTRQQLGTMKSRAVLLDVARGHVTHSAVADGVGAAFTPVEDALERAGSRG